MGLRAFSVGLCLGVCLVGCAGFSYKYYGMELPSYEGKLLGPEPADDLPMTVCQPDEQAKGKCVVMLAEEFRAFRTDYAETKQRLKECQESKE